MITSDFTYHVGVTAVSHPMRMDGAALRVQYEWIIDSFSRREKPPNTFEAKGASFKGKGYLDYARDRKRLEATDFALLSRIGIALFRQKQNGMTIGWEWMCRSLDRQVVLSPSDIRWEPTGWWEASLCMFPDFLGLSEATCVDLATEFARLTVEEYGYLFFMHRNRGPMHYVIGMGYDPVNYPNDRTLPESENISTWSYSREIRGSRPWLRDVYPVNFVGPKLAAMSVEGKRFLDWVRARPERGTIEPFPSEREANGFLWKPPLERILALREQLYRAGLVWHRQYYLDHSDGKAPPFVPTDPPPETIRASNYKGWDPKLTR